MRVGSPIWTHIEVPGYAGSLSSNLLIIDGGTNLPPKKWCGPRNLLAQSFGAVKETYTRGTSVLTLFQLNEYPALYRDSAKLERRDKIIRKKILPACQV